MSFIDKQILPALGHVLSSDDRELLSLPVRYGGLGIPVYQEICSGEYEKVREREIEREIKDARETTQTQTI